MNRPMLLMFLALIMTAPCRAESPALRYRFTPGQHLVYERHGEGNGYSVWGRRELWVLGVTESGYFDLLLYEANQSVRPGQEPGVPDQAAMTRFTLAPDGRIQPGQAHDDQVNPRSLLPQLPGPDEARWVCEDTARAINVRYTLAQTDTGAPGTALIEAGFHSITDEIYGVTREQRYRFDTASGLATRVDNKLKQTGRINSERTGYVELIDINTLDAETLAALTRDAERYLNAKEVYQDSVKRAEGMVPAEALAAMDDASAGLVTARDGIGSPLFRELAEHLLHQHENTKAYITGNAQVRSELVGKPAPDWRLEDLAGNKHALADYRGRVVILDYWYRGCYWCVMGMPQLNQLTDHFRDGPVAVLGMNTDRNLNDALFVQDKMGLRYPNLRADDTPSLYRVDSFPTLIVIDPAGVVRGYHVGYSPTLYEDLVAEVEGLLAETQR